MNAMSMCPTLDCFVTMQKGYAFKSEWYTESGRALVKVSDFTGESVDTNDLTYIPEEIARAHEKYALHSGDVIVQTVGSWPSNPASVVGKVIRVPRAAAGALLNQNAVKLMPNESIDPVFLFYRLKNEDFKTYIIGTAQGAASQASITLESIRAFKFCIPSLDVQRRITYILSAYDELIENGTRRIKILEEMAQMIYREWFVNFRFPGHEKVKMVESELGPIPEGWAAKKLGDALTLEYGKALKECDRLGGYVLVYGSSGVLGHHSQKLARGPGIIVGRKGNVGSVFFCHSDFWVIDTAYFVRSELSLYFLYFNLLTQNFLNNDAAVPGLNRNQAHSLPVVVPETTTLGDF